MAKTNKSGTRIFYVPDFLLYTNSYEMSPTERISEEIPWTKQVGVGPNRRISEEIPRTKAGWGLGRRQGTMIYPSLAFILIGKFYKVDKRDNYRQC